MITLSYQGKTATAQIVDQCPTCPYGGLDLTHGLFAFLAGDPEQIGTVNGEWSWSTGGNSVSSSSTPTSTPPPPTTSTTPEAPSSTPTPKPTSSAEQATSSQSSKTSSTVPTSPSSSSFSSSAASSTTTSSTPSPTIEGPQVLQQFDIAVVQIAALAVGALSVQD